MTDVYRRLAKKLDEMPNGFPATESGVELKILRKIFSPQEADLALDLSPTPGRAETIARRLGKPADEAKSMLDKMAEKGQLGRFMAGGQYIYMLFPFLPGIYEFQKDRIDKELADLFEEYLPVLSKTFGGYKPAATRVVPINAQIRAELQIHRYEDIRRLVEEAKSLYVVECICRKERGIEGKPCKHTLENCLLLSSEEGAFDSYFLKGKSISQEEALKVLAGTEEEGLVHCTYNVQKGQRFVCNCCPCCCLILRSLREFKAPYILAKSNFIASIDQESCTACGVCTEGRCPMDAISDGDNAYRVLAERCIGCGVCTVTCPSESITLVRKPESEQDEPPADLMEWGFQRDSIRNKEVKVK